MPEPFLIKVGGLPILLIPDTHKGQFDFVKKTQDFSSQDEPEIVLKIHCGSFPDFENEKILFDTEVAWQLVEVNGKKCFKVRNPALFQVGIFPEDFRSGDICVASRPEDPELFVFPFANPMGELFMMNRLSLGLGVMLHAAGVIYDGEGYVFAGKGEAGKSTTARLWAQKPGARVLNDDKVIVRREGEGYRLYGTPWHGEGGLALMDSAPLKRIYILKQAPKNEAKPLSTIVSVSKLLNRAFIPLWDQEKMDFCLEFLTNLTQSIPCQELGFLPEPSAVDFVLES